ncbi:hypothetical protein HGRIS_012381 [Hohenbuehelia grisea]|uniref:AB hydrolase-1 domain-containing protein n=1 Tax=Hohenbuehelia grisea TaxID=104357 RepID=A0ABR3IS23_9AGAR
MPRSYPPPDSPERPHPPFATRPLIPVYPPPADLLHPKPALPTPSRSPSVVHLGSTQFSVSTHLVPAAHLRSVPQDIPIPPPPGPEVTDKRARRAAFDKIRVRLADIRRDVATERTHSGFPNVLWACVNRYVPVRSGAGGSGSRSGANGKGLTLFFAHANGFHKETWEPTITNLLSPPGAENVNEIWSWEAVQHGDAALINRDKLCAIYDWTDNARDISNFLLYFLPTKTTAASLPLHLPRIPDEETQERLDRGFRGRTFVAVGHSFGGCTSVLAALTYPRLFSSIILVDPVIVQPRLYENTNDPFLEKMSLGAIVRRDTWESRSEAHQLMLKNPFFQAWDPSALALFVEHGLYATPSGSVHLKMPGVQEGISFLERLTPYEVWERLPHVDERITLHWIMPGKEGGDRDFGGPTHHRVRVWRRAKNASNVIVETAGHLIPQEDPKACAREIQAFLEKRYSGAKSRL